MGVDASYHFPHQLQPEIALFALAKACGVDPPKIDGDDNVFTAVDFVEAPIQGTRQGTRKRPISLGFYDIWFPASPIHTHFYLHNSEDALGSQGWNFSTRSHAGALAAFRALAEAFGGYIIWTDYDDSSTVYGIPEEGLAFGPACKLAYAMEQVTVTPKDSERAAY